jgi:hypothetical protein
MVAFRLLVPGLGGAELKIPVGWIHVYQVTGLDSSYMNARSWARLLYTYPSLCRMGCDY